MGWESHVSLVPVLGVGGALDVSSVQFLALYAQAHADIPLFFLTLVTLSSSGLLASSTGLLVDSMKTMFNSSCNFYGIGSSTCQYMK
jgi:hypothetical protein